MLQKQFVIFGLIISSLWLSACQTTQIPVIERENQTFETTGLGETKTIAKTNAISYAKQQCGIKSPVVIKDHLKYHGILDENTGRMVDQAVTVLGGILGTKTPNIARDDNYEYTINFRCR